MITEILIYYSVVLNNFLIEFPFFHLLQQKVTLRDQNSAKLHKKF